MTSEAFINPFSLHKKSALSAAGGSISLTYCFMQLHKNFLYVWHSLNIQIDIQAVHYGTSTFNTHTEVGHL